MNARAAVLTAASPGAVAVVRVWGQGALAVADRVFRPLRGPALSATPVGRPRVGRAGAGTGDEVVAVVEAPGPEVEVHCHGGPAAVALVLDALRRAGAEVATAGAWHAHRARDRTSPGALDDLGRAPTVRGAEILMDQAEGAFAAEVSRLADLLATESGRDQALAGIDRLLARASVGLRLVEGWRVVLAGRPNVGKSRLLNALAGFERAIVSPQPGTTRDVVVVRTALDAWPVALADTAGLRDPADPIEAAGVALARSEQGSADLTLLVLDRSEQLTEMDRALLDGLPSSLRVANKADLPPAWDEANLGAVAISAERGAGIAALIETIGRRLVPDPPGPGAAVPFRPEQVRVLERASRRLREDRPGRAAALLRLAAGPGERTREDATRG